ncbi:suppressor of fused domain protein [Olivibacter domesticus]|uniref:Suppressor of fused protein (SUFU) n=1 Tax=Olivibacter domesticus TaxID=407022 RepID=A0A1H7JRV1_OLID1|nr:suppressor of fused domain protein [Olivibacter domesticus]SEK77124.1 Suppressor of fused protein (SUFU) [Olivibacter domesticus]
MKRNKYYEKVIAHYVSNWGNPFSENRWNKGPVHDLDKNFHILEFELTETRNMWTYATCGMSALSDLHPVELHLFSEDRDEGLVELLTIVAHYHNTAQKLDLGHTANFGRSWKKDSKCTYGLISLPYLDGPNVENLKLGEGKSVGFYWLIPVTEKEAIFKKDHGIEALENKFEQKQFNYLNPERSSVI